MFKLYSTIVKDFRILLRDRVGVVFMFAMPILLVLVITSLQQNTFELVNDSKVPLLFCNKDKGELGNEMLGALRKVGMFELSEISKNLNEEQINNAMHEVDALLVIVIPENFSDKMYSKANAINSRVLKDFDLSDQPVKKDAVIAESIKLYYHPVLQDSYRKSIQGALRSSLQLVENKQILKTLYLSISEKDLPADLEGEMINNQTGIDEIPVSRDGSRSIPNATQHNIPAWTIFAMFFIVTSLGSNLVKEKLSGSFMRLKTLPTNYLITLFSKKIVYLSVCMTQVFVIFSIGVLVFPLIGLPRLDLPSDLLGLFAVSLICGWCAISYAICVGVFAQTQEQANGFGAVSVVILAAIGGILVPSFAMPDSFQSIILISPLHWCLESYYGLFLEGGKFEDVLVNILPLLAIAVFIQLVALIGLKVKNLI